MSQFFPILSGFLYFLLGLFLFFVNLWIFEKWTPFHVKEVIFEAQNKALGHIVRGQLLAQGILIAFVIYFTGNSLENHTFDAIQNLVKSFGTTIIFAIFGMIFLQ